MLKRYVPLLAMTSLSFGFAECHHGCGSKDETEECIICDENQGGAVKCNFDYGYSQEICGPDQTLAAVACSEAGGEWEAKDVCAPDSSETGGDHRANPWDLGSKVIFDSETGEYVIDQQALELLKRDPTPIFEDSSRLRELESGYYEVEKTGELTAALGWSTGDVLLELDGYPLQGLDALASAYTELANNTAFELTIQRGRAEVRLHYRVE